MTSISPARNASPRVISLGRTNIASSADRRLNIRLHLGPPYPDECHDHFEARLWACSELPVIRLTVPVLGLVRRRRPQPARQRSLSAPETPARNVLSFLLPGSKESVLDRWLLLLYFKSPQAVLRIGEAELKGKTLSTIELRLPSRLGYEKVAMSTAASVAKLMGFADERVEDLKTAVAEACINAMEHGNRLNEALIVGVILSLDADSLEVKVTDTGEGPKGVITPPDIDKKMHGEQAARGMGIFLIQALVDEAEWVSSPPSGSYTRMVIHLRRTGI
jgi:serine/threonine-protein kinase RsbW